MTRSDPDRDRRIADLQRQLNEFQDQGDRGWQLAQEAARAAGCVVRVVPGTGGRAYDLAAAVAECTCPSGCPCPRHWDAGCRLHRLDDARRGPRGVVEIADWPWPDCRYGAHVVTKVNPEIGAWAAEAAAWVRVRTVPGGGER